MSEKIKVTFLRDEHISSPELGKHTPRRVAKGEELELPAPLANSLRGRGIVSFDQGEKVKPAAKAEGKPYTDMSVNELKDALKAKGLKVSGNKAALIDRLNKA